MPTAKDYRLLYYITKNKYYTWELINREDLKTIQEAKIKISYINKKSLLFEGSDLNQDITIPVKELCDLDYDEKTSSYTFYLFSNPVFLHKITAIIF